MPKRTCTVCCASAGRLPARPAPFAMLGMPSRARFAEPIPKAAIGFRPEFLDFQRGIRVGNLEDHERITRLLKLEVEAREPIAAAIGERPPSAGAAASSGNGSPFCRGPIAKQSRFLPP